MYYYKLIVVNCKISQKCAKTAKDKPGIICYESVPRFSCIAILGAVLVNYFAGNFHPEERELSKDGESRPPPRSILRAIVTKINLFICT